MSDDRKTPLPGGARPPTRVPPRDTQDMIRELSRDVELLGERTHRDIEQLAERIDARLARGAESLTRMDERVATATAVADQARLDIKHAEERRLQDALKDRTIPWIRVIPICITVLVLAATVLLVMDRKVDGEKFDSKVEMIDVRSRAQEAKIFELEKDLASAKTSVEILRSVLDIVHKAVKSDEQIPRRKK